mgnify:CR=1 FL=1
MNWIKAYVLKIYHNMGQYLRWLFFSALTGTAVGLFASLFSWCLNQATALRTRNQYMFLTLPLGGLLIVFLYKAFHYENNGGTDSVIESIHSEFPSAWRSSSSVPPLSPSSAVVPWGGRALLFRSEEVWVKSWATSSILMKQTRKSF